jgi:hypothetical protein
VTATDAPPRDLAAICEAARLASCGHCWERPGLACTSSGHGDGFHVSRFGRAWRRGLLSDADYKAVLHAAGAFTAGTVIYGGTGRRA